MTWTPFPDERVEVGGHGGDLRLALAGAHFGDFSLVKHDGADDLDVEMRHEGNFPTRRGVDDLLPFAEHPVGRLAEHRKCFGQQIVKRLTARKPAAELRGFGFQILVGQAGNRFAETVDATEKRIQFAQIAILFGSKEKSEKINKRHCTASLWHYSARYTTNGKDQNTEKLKLFFPGRHSA